ncbi:MAG: AMP-binding protein [Candidatus Omnitrophica bacterium]|nr:AMP-binding protein [Candidatus Omnitrophota bacterium]
MDNIDPVYNIAENLVNSVAMFRDRVAIETKTADTIKTLTYGQLGDRVNSFAHFLSSQSILKSDRVGMVIENRPEFAVIFFALSYIGAIAVPLDPHMTTKDAKNILSDAGAKLVLVSKETQAIVEPLKDFIPSISIEDIKESGASQGFKKATIEPDEVMLLLYTSGTTDLPKGVMLTHKNLCSNFHSLKKLKIFSAKDIVLSVLPLYHSYAMMTTFLAPLFSGAKVVYVPSDWPEKLGEYIKTSRATVFIGVPQIYHMMHSRMMKKIGEIHGLAGMYVRLVIKFGLAKIFLRKIKNAFGKNLRFFVSGGAKLDKDVARDFFKLGLKVIEGYGLTETSPVASLNPLKRQKIGSIGKPIVGVELKIMNKDADGIGEIAIKGPNVMKGYYKKEEKTKEVMRDEWFLSGDLGYEDKDGYFYVTGRSKEMIVLSSGKNVFPEEVEKHYSQTPYIKEMCAMGVVKEKGGSKLEYLHGIIVPDTEFFKERGEMNLRQVMASTFDNLSQGVPGYRRIMGFTLTQTPLPRTMLGKLKRYEVKNKFLPLILEEGKKKQELSPEDKELIESEIGRKLIDCLKESLDIEGDIHPSDSIELDLGVDSLSRVELMLAIEKCFDVDIPDEMAMAEIFTAKDMILKVGELLNQPSAISHQLSAQSNKSQAVHWSEILKQPLPKDFQKKISLRLSWTDYMFAFFVKGFISLFFRLFYLLRVQGAYKIPKKGPYVLCVNHTSFFDGLIVTAGVPFRILLGLFFIAFRRYFIVPVIRNFVRRARIIPIDASQIIEAMQGSAFILKHNKALCIFPEGERSIDGKVKEFKKGIGIIAKEYDIPLVPVYIKGAFEAWPRTQRFPKLHPIKIRFGDPVSKKDLIERGMKLGAEDEYDAVCMAIRDEVDKLK